MANPIEKDEDRSLEEDITEWFEEAFEKIKEKIKGAFDKHECKLKEKTRPDTCHFFEDCND